MWFYPKKGAVKSPPSQNVAVAQRFKQNATSKLPSNGLHFRWVWGKIHLILGAFWVHSGAFGEFRSGNVESSSILEGKYDWHQGSWTRIPGMCHKSTLGQEAVSLHIYDTFTARIVLIFSGFRVLTQRKLSEKSREKNKISPSRKVHLHFSRLKFKKSPKIYQNP